MTTAAKVFVLELGCMAAQAIFAVCMGDANAKRCRKWIAVALTLVAALSIGIALGAGYHQIGKFPLLISIALVIFSIGASAITLEELNLDYSGALRLARKIAARMIVAGVVALGLAMYVNAACQNSALFIVPCAIVFFGSILVAVLHIQDTAILCGLGMYEADDEIKRRIAAEHAPHAPSGSEHQLERLRRYRELGRRQPGRSRY